MKILIAPNYMKGSLAAMAAGEAIRDGILKLGEHNVTISPAPDGGDGFAEALGSALGGSMRQQQVRGPLGRRVYAKWYFVEETKTAVIEMSLASGLALLDDGERDIMRASSFGTGELIKLALNAGAKRIILGIGGSATNDCALGTASALGAVFTGALCCALDGNQPGLAGIDLLTVTGINLDRFDTRIKKGQVSINVACDVTAPLFGKRGAAYVYGPQKGADEHQVLALDAGLRRFASILQRDLEDCPEPTVPGSGAAGGMGFGLSAMFGAKLKPGFEIVREATGLDEKVEAADLVISCEGTFGPDSMQGKGPFAVAKLAKEKGKRCVILAGQVGEGLPLPTALLEDGIVGLHSVMRDLKSPPADVEVAIEGAAEFLEQLAGEVMGDYLS